MRHRPHNSAQRGFSLVELMIALTLGLLLTAAVGSLFYTNKRNFNQNQLIAEMQDNARFALETLARDLAMAGYLGGMTDAHLLKRDSETLGAPANDCTPGADGAPGWAFDPATLEFLNNPSAVSAAARYGCLNAAHVVSDTDVVSIRRVSGQATALREETGDPVSLSANTVYLRTNRTEGSLFHSGAAAEEPGADHPPSLAPYNVWEYVSRLYFVRNYAETPGDGVPTLCRAILGRSAGGGVEIEPLAEGIEDVQIAFGIDTDGDAIANRYAVDPSEDELELAVTARIQLLVRSIGRDFSYTNDKTYRLLSKPDQSFEGAQNNEDHYYRRVIQTTVMLRNPILAQGLTP